MSSEIHDPKELFALKQRAMKYYAENKVPDRMEEVLNSTFFDNPNDVYGHLCNCFEKYSLPAVVSYVKGSEVIDSRGLPALQTQIYCTIKNNSKLVSCEVLGSDSNVMDNSTAAERDFDDQERYSDLQVALQLISGDINTTLSGVEPTDQRQIDQSLIEIIRRHSEEDEEKKKLETEENTDENQAQPPAAAASPGGGKKSAKGKKGPPVVIVPDEPKEKLCPGCMAVSAVSTSVCCSAAVVMDTPLYQYISQLKFANNIQEMKLPLPMVTIIQSGKSALGKQNCIKEYMIIPSVRLSVQESMKHICDIYQTVMKNLVTKLGVTLRNVSESGAICPQFDRPEQGLDAIQEAMTLLELTPGEDFFIGINAASHEMFDYDKGKYEVVQGLQKLPDDMPDFWSDLLNRYPAIIALIDPIRKEDKPQWMGICERVSERCYVTWDRRCPTPIKLKNYEAIDDFKTSAVVLRCEQMNSVSDIIDASTTMQGQDNQVVISSQTADSNSTFIVDLAVGVQAMFLKVGAPSRGERVAKLNRLLQISDELKHQQKLGQWDEHTFPKLTLPTLPETPTEGATTDNQLDDANKK